MLFHVFLVVVAVGSTVQIARASARTPARIGETLLVWTLAAYCGVPMAAFMVWGLARPVELARLTGFPPGSPFQDFTVWALLGMAVAAALAIRVRGTYLVGPALAWAVFFVGATTIHLRQYADLGLLDLHTGAMIFATHGLISVVLVAGLVLWGMGNRQEAGASAG